MNKNGNMTPSQVAALIEDLKSEFRFVTEVLAPLPERLSGVETRLGRVEDEVRLLKDAFRIEIPSMRRRLEAVEKSR